MLSGTHEDERQQWTWHFLQFLPLLAALAGRAFCQKSGRRPEFLFLSHQGFTFGNMNSVKTIVSLSFIKKVK